jgi:hypothetical protein
VKLQATADVELGTLVFQAPVPYYFKVSQDKAPVMAMAVNRINSVLAWGSFDFSQEEGLVCFRLCNNYSCCRLSQKAMTRMLEQVCKVMVRYAQPLWYLGDEMVSYARFLDLLKEAEGEENG